MSTNASKPVGVIGSGTMGAGIAQAAAASGWKVVLFDVEQTLVTQAKQSIAKRFDRLTEKDRITAEQAQEYTQRINTTTSLSDLWECDLIIEAIVEDFDIKTKVLKEVATIAQNAIIATNTSSLSVNDLGKAIGCAERFIGMHFFFPAPIMQLVEVVRGTQSSDTAIQRATLIAEAWGKTVVQASDTPGFIVNRIARPYYLESWRILEDRIASVDCIDESLMLLGEFRMGPFMLTDLIGQDINVASTRSVWERLGKPSRLAPSEYQESLIPKGHLGKKTGCGAYAHSADRKTIPAIIIDQQELELSDHLKSAINAFCLEASCTSGSMLQKYIFSRVLSGIINEAMWSLVDGVASEKDINTAMKLGTNYPLGPFEWANKIGLHLVHDLLDALNETVEDNRFASPPIDTATAT